MLSAPTSTESSVAPSAASILGAFELPLGGVVSGVAAGGQFVVEPSGPLIETFDPTTGEVLARVQSASAADYAAASLATRRSFERWRLIPRPNGATSCASWAMHFASARTTWPGDQPGNRQDSVRGARRGPGSHRHVRPGGGSKPTVVRQADRLRTTRAPFDGAVAAVGCFGHHLRLQFSGRRPRRGWALALICGDSVLWKPSSLTPLISIACQQIFHEVTNGTDAKGVIALVTGPAVNRRRTAQ